MSKVPIKKLEDFKGVEIRASGMAAQALGAWGAIPVGMPFPAFPEALQKGVVKGMFSGVDLLQDFNFAEMLPYVTLVKEISWPFAVFMNIDTWNSLPKDVQKVLDDLSREHAEWTGTYHDGRVQEATEWAKKTYNVKVFELSKQERARWIEMLNPLIVKWIKESEAKGLPAKKIVEDLRSYVKKYTE
jgi:TRAP-type C4-dicarboxylate transport system substrate-binding protein